MNTHIIINRKILFSLSESHKIGLNQITDLILSVHNNYSHHFKFSGEKYGVVNLSVVFAVNCHICCAYKYLVVRLENNLFFRTE